MTYLKHILLTMILLQSILGCTQVVTAPIAIAGAAVSATIDVTSSAVGAIVSSDEKEEKES